jgi:drug/metabolite transporter (DMT)-like permease
MMEYGCHVRAFSASTAGIKGLDWKPAGDRGLSVIHYLFIGACVIFTVYGQIAIKYGAVQASAVPDLSANPARYMLTMLLNPLVLSGLAAGLASSLAWFFAIQRTEVGFAYPFLASSFILVPLAARVVFNEPFGLLQLVGGAFIMVGITLNALAR